MPEETAEYQVYQYRAEPLNTPIIRYILHNCLKLPLEWWSTNDFEEKINQYHQENGGALTELVNPHASVYSVLCEMVRRGILESRKEAGNRYFRVPSPPPPSDPIESLLRVIRQERERLDAERETLHQRKAQLDTILSDYE